MTRSRLLHRLCFSVAILAGILGVDPPPLSAGSVPAATGPEMVQNITTTGDQTAPRVAVGSGGGALTGGGGDRQIAVWQSPGIDGSGDGIVARIFDEDGRPVPLPGMVEEIQVNTITLGNQTNPDVAIVGSGEYFAVVWEGPDGNGGRDIFLRAFSTLDGTPHMATATETVVNQLTVGDQHSPAIAFGVHLIVVWQGPGATTGQDILGRLIDPSLMIPPSAEFNVTDLLGNTAQSNPAVAGMVETDLFLVAFEHGDADGKGVFYRMVDGTEGPIGTGGRVNTNETGDQAAPAVGSSNRDPDTNNLNRFVVAWESPDGDGRGVFYQRYDDVGNGALGQERANVDLAGDDFAPTVAVDEGETDFVDFIIAWERAPTALQGGAILIRGRRLPGSGSPLAGGTLIPEFAISSTSGVHSRPAIADDSLGNLTAFWQSSGADGSGEAILARRFTVEVVFEDGFETGDTSAWSATVPPPVP